MSLESPKKAYQYCLALLCRREYSQAELRQKMQQKDCDKAIIDAVLNQLQADNYQSDSRFAEVFCRSRVNKGQGRNKIRYELQQRGIDDNLINAQLPIYEQKFVENAKRLIEKKSPRGNLTKLFSDYSLKSKIMRSLVNKGYDYDTINRAFEIINDES